MSPGVDRVRRQVPVLTCLAVSGLVLAGVWSRIDGSPFARVASLVVLSLLCGSGVAALLWVTRPIRHPEGPLLGLMETLIGVGTVMIAGALSAGYASDFFYAVFAPVAAFFFIGFMVYVGFCLPSWVRREWGR